MSKAAEELTEELTESLWIISDLRDENIALKVKLQMAKEKFNEISALCLDLQYMLEKLK